MFKKLVYLLDRKERKKLFMLIIFAVITSVSEVFGLSMIVPFMAMATDYKVIEGNRWLNGIYRFLDFHSYINFIAIFGAVVVLVFLAKNILILVFNYLVVKFNRDNYFNITSKLMNTYMKMKYGDFSSGKISDFSKNILAECNYVMTFVESALFLISDGIVITAIYMFMVYINWKITISITIFLLINIFIVRTIILGKSEKLGSRKNTVVTEYYEDVERTFGNYKYIKLLPDDKKVLEKFEKSCREYTDIEKKFLGIQPVPRNILEFSGFFIVILIIIGSLYFYGENGIQEIMPLITLFFIALYRVLPSVSRVVLNYQYILYFKGSVDIILKELQRETENLGDEKIEFRNKLTLENISFGYGEGNEVLKNIDLEIKKGDRIAFIGESGSGKTTLADIVIGLFIPDKGKIYVDDEVLTNKNRKSWRSQIGYIPQDVTLFYGSVKDNVVFGREYDREKLEVALKKARIWDFLTQKDGIDTIVGDKGNMLSGGQKQRIGIARALYENPEILVLDEATSALDTLTEKAIMEEIYSVSKSKTLIIVAHRLTTLEGCNRIIRLENKKAMELNEDISEIIKKDMERLNA